jgi:PAS domain S-box-containing protein
MRLRPGHRREAQVAFERLVSGRDPSASIQSVWLRKDLHKTRVSWTARLVTDGDRPSYVVATGTETTRGQALARRLEETACRGESPIVRIHPPGRAFECRLTPVFEADGAVDRVIGVTSDVAESEATEVMRHEAEGRIRAVFDESALGMILIDRDGRSLESNRAFQRLLGYGQDELSAMSTEEYTHAADRGANVAALRDVFAGVTDGCQFESRYIAKDGSGVWARVHVSPVRDSSGCPRMAVGTFEDVSAHKALEEQLRQALKMEALGRLAGGVAHDFNNLLTVVNGYADLLVDALGDDERAADAIEIRRAGDRAAELTSQLLAFGRRGSSALAPVDLNARISALVPMLRRLLGEAIEVEVQLDPALGAVDADPSQLDQVVMSLAANARDAMVDGGLLRLTTSHVEALSQPDAGREGTRTWAHLEISDSGVGIEPAVLDRIFEPFFTTKQKGKSTGLGLATVYSIVEQMAGRIRVESTVGHGSRFIVDLPLSKARSGRPGHRGDTRQS